MPPMPRSRFPSLLVAAALLSAASAHAQNDSRLVALINAYRAAPDT